MPLKINRSQRGEIKCRNIEKEEKYPINEGKEDHKKSVNKGDLEDYYTGEENKIDRQIKYSKKQMLGDEIKMVTNGKQQL